MAANEPARIKAHDEEKAFHEHTRAMYADTRETLRKSMEKIASSIPLERKDESDDYLRAKKQRETLVEIEEEPSAGSAQELAECIEAAIGLKKELMEQRAKCVASGFKSAATVFEESINKLSKMVAKYEKKKREI